MDVYLLSIDDAYSVGKSQTDLAHYLKMHMHTAMLLHAAAAAAAAAGVTASRSSVARTCLPVICSRFLSSGHAKPTTGQAQ